MASNYNGEPSAKQIAWRKKFAKMSKAGKFKKSKSWSKQRRKYGGKRVSSKTDDELVEYGKERGEKWFNDYYEKSGTSEKHDMTKEEIINFFTSEIEASKRNAKRTVYLNTRQHHNQNIIVYESALKRFMELA